MSPSLPARRLPAQGGRRRGRLFRKAVTPPPDTADDERIAAPGAAHDPLVESYRKLADVFHELLSEQSLDDLLHRIADTVGELIPYDDITFYEADEASRELKAVYALGKDAVEVLADPPFPYGVGITGWAVEHREPVLANRAELDPRVRFITDTQPDPESLIVVPLIARSKLKGTLNIYRSGFQEFTEDEFRLVVRFGDAAALALDNAHIRASLERQAQTDPLTGLWNHRAFHERLRLELVEASAGHSAGLARDARPRRLQARQRRLQPRDRGRGPRRGRRDPAPLDPLRRLRLPDRRRGVRDHRALERPRGGPPPRRARAGAGRARRLRPRRLGEPLDRHRRRPRARSEPARPRRLRGGRDDDREDARPRPGRRLRGRPGRAALRAPGRPPGRDPLDRAPEAAARGLVEAEPAQRRRQDRRDDRGGAAAPDRLPQLSRLRPRRRRPPARSRSAATSSPPARRWRCCRPGSARGSPDTSRETGRPFLSNDAARSELGVQIAGTARIEESLVAVPLLYGASAVGVIVVSKLGPRPVRPGRAAPARGPRGPCLDARSSTRGSTRSSAARRRARRRCSSCPRSSRRARGSRRSRRGSRPARRGSCGRSAPRSGCPSTRPACSRAARRGSTTPRVRTGRWATSCRRASSGSSPRRATPFLMTREDLLEHLVDADEQVCGHGRRGRLSRGRRHRRDRGRARLARRAGRPAARAPRRDRRPGAAGGLERALVPGPRAVVPLDDRGARERARGERRVHLLPRAVDLRRGAPGGRGARPHTRRAEAPRAGCALPRHREDRRPCRRSCGSPARSPSRSGP